MTLGPFWKFPAGAFRAVKLPWNNSNTPGGKASCFPRSAWDLLLRSFTCSPKNNHSWEGGFYCLPQDPEKAQFVIPICQQEVPTPCLHQPLFAWGCVLWALVWRTKWEWEPVNRLGRAVLRSPWCSQPYTHALSVWHQRQEKLCLGQPNLNQTLVGNSEALPGGDRAPTTSLPHTVLQKLQITPCRPNHHPPVLRGCSGELFSLSYAIAYGQQSRNSFSFAKKSLHHNVVILLPGN